MADAVAPSMPDVAEPSMADATSSTTEDPVLEVVSKPPAVAPKAPQPKSLSRAQLMNKLYALPAPLRTFPLPTFVPHNPISLFHILYVWVSQTLNPSSSHFDTLYQGWFSPDTRSIHVTDSRSIRGLWEQGFYGKGSLSRSEPAWLDGEKKRRGGKVKVTSEEVTRKRRAERQETKWERARKEREAIDQKLLEEAETAVRQNNKNNVELMGKSVVPLVAERVESQVEVETPEPASSSALGSLSSAPVGPLEILALPNSDADLESRKRAALRSLEETSNGEDLQRLYSPPVGPLELLALPNSILATVQCHIEAEILQEPIYINGHTGPSIYTDSVSKSVVVDNDLRVSKAALEVNEHALTAEADLVGGSETNDEVADVWTHSEESTETNGSPSSGSILNGRPTTPRMRHRKSVRFSPTVEKNTFMQSEPPSPERAATVTTAIVQTETVAEEPLVIKEQEHLQVTLEEAFFLSYALGALKVLDPETKSPISNEDLFYLFRKTSYFPPRTTPSLSADDPFMVSYIVYHHFRSLGWVIRSGVKFSCDYMLYVRGPVFSHAEFGIVVIPSYSDPYWSSDVFLQNYVKAKETRTWAWMSCINRVIGQVKKTLVLCYVDIPRPLDAAEEQKLGIDGILARYKIREVVMKRFVANRQRG